jgi:hypothetical protein
MHAHESYRLDTKIFRKRSNQKGSIEELGGAGRMQKCRRMRAIASTQNFRPRLPITCILNGASAQARKKHQQHMIFRGDWPQKCRNQCRGEIFPAAARAPITLATPCQLPQARVTGAKMLKPVSQRNLLKEASVGTTSLAQHGPPPVARTPRARCNPARYREHLWTRLCLFASTCWIVLTPAGLF